VRGQFAVGEVILNRVESAAYPQSLCGVVKQGTGRKYACQFSYNCDGNPKVVNEQDAWDRVGKIAAILLDGAARDLTGVPRISIPALSTRRGRAVSCAHHDRRASFLPRTCPHRCELRSQPVAALSRLSLSCGRGRGIAGGNAAS
jgi:Cell wall hydrolyses involved in spore germination